MDLVLLLILFFIIGGGIITGLVMASEIKKHRPVRAATDAHKYIVPGKCKMSVSDDTFLRTRVQRIKIKSSQSSSGGR
ncbi:MAG: hypothetical protein FWB75_07980 [Oscillospiraceae bacterium]|nr:hypothetical protein [Oscillospiraceae bacterium]